MLDELFTLLAGSAPFLLLFMAPSISLESDLRCVCAQLNEVKSTFAYILWKMFSGTSAFGVRDGVDRWFEVVGLARCHRVPDS